MNSSLAAQTSPNTAELAQKEGILGQDPLLNQCFDSVAYAQHHMAKFGLSATDHGYVAGMGRNSTMSTVSRSMDRQ